MSPRTLKKLVVAVLVLLVATQLAEWLSELFNAAAGGVGWLAATGLYMLCYRKARMNVEPNFAYYVWMWVPTLALVLVPTAWELLQSEEETWGGRLGSMLPLLVEFVLPVLLLVVVFYGLSGLERRERDPVRREVDAT